MSCTQKRQLVRFPKVRILKQWFRHFNDHKEFHNEGNLHLFSLMALFSYANFRSNERVINGVRYMEAPGQWVCKLGSLPRILRVHSKAQALDLMKYFEEKGFLQFEVIDEDQEIIRYTINDWKRHCTHLAYNYYSYKGSGFFFFPLPIGRLLLQAAKTEGRIVFSELDAIMDMWLHTIVNDPAVKGSEYMPVVYYSNMHGMPLLSYTYLAKRWGWSKSRVGRFMIKASEYGIISRVSFSSSRGSVISVCRYREMIYGDACEELELHGIGEIIGIGKAIDVVKDDHEQINVSIETRVPPAKTIGRARKALKIQVFQVSRSSFFARQIPLVFYTAYTSVNGNVPYFTAAELTTTSFETYSDLDTLGRCGVTYACIGQDLMPTEERGSIGMVKPTGWHTVRYDDLIDGKYLYNRCHLIGYQLTGENANTKNLITGTRYLNIEGMLPFENMVADYIQETNNHVLYRVTPIFEGNNLLANGVLMEGYGYTRISKKKQNIERQIRNIKQHFPAAIIIQEAYTGTKINRKEWNKLFKIVKAGDRIIFDSVSRMSRNAEEGYAAYEALYNRGVDLVFLKEPHINTETFKRVLANAIPLTGTNVDYILEGINQYLLALAKEQIRIAFDQAEKEVTDLHQRTREGIETARLNGKQIGLEKGRKLTTKKSVSAKEIIKKHSKDFCGTLDDTEVITLSGLSRNTYYKYKRELKNECA